jgi:two-component system nitrogen regulation response regulator NtrX
MKKILIMEDDARSASSLAFRLRAAGYNTVSAADGFAGLRSALRNKSHLVLVDLWLPNAIDFSSAEEMKRRHPTMPVIFIGAGKKSDLLGTAKKLGATDFFEKPYDSEQLLQVIARALDSQEAGTVAEGTFAAVTC